jgi:outer membrane protein OmpA-like peptidoglycan-associated protein
MNRKLLVILIASASVGAVPAAAFAQDAQQGQAIASSDVLSQISMFNYREGPKSDLFFRGTPIAASAAGKAQVEYQGGNAQISVEVEKLPEPASLGPYTAYVLWTLTPDGRATNQGVLAGPEGGNGKMDTQYGASQFALIVTAEPHFAVTVPSTMVALFNVADNVKGEESKVTTLTERTDYSNLEPIAIDEEVNSAEVVQARYAVAIAAAAGADRFAPEAYATANQKLAAAKTALLGKRSSEQRTAPGLAREAVIAGEDARRAAMIASAASAAEGQQLAAASAATEAANAVAAQAATETAAATEVATEVERLRSETAAAAAARNDLLARLNSALPTRESDRGLISEIGGVHFATGAADIDVQALESLAKFSGIVASYPDLRFNVEGHTDSTGSVAMNNELSLRRAMAARDYLIGQGVPASSIDVAGLGLSMPVGDNSTSDGRARNRRVEIVISGGPLSSDVPLAAR